MALLGIAVGRAIGIPIVREGGSGLRGRQMPMLPACLTRRCANTALETERGANHGRGAAMAAYLANLHERTFVGAEFRVGVARAAGPQSQSPLTRFEVHGRAGACLFLF